MKSQQRRKAIAAATFVALSAYMTTAHADTAAEIRLLKQRLKVLEAKVAEDAKKQKAAEVRRANAKPVAAAVCKDGPCQSAPTPPPVWVSFTNGLKVESYDKDFSAELHGRVQIDGGVSSQPEQGYSSNVGVRRAWLELYGKAFKYWQYAFQYDFASPGGVKGIQDAYIAFSHPSLSLLPFTSQPLVFQAGHMKGPMGLAWLNSNNFLEFIERPLASDAFAPGRHLGVSALTHGDRWSTKFGIYSTSLQDTSSGPSPASPYNPAVPNSVATGGQQYLDVIGRLTYAPILEKEALLHLGGGVVYQVVNSATAQSEGSVLSLGSNTRTEANILYENLLGTPDLSCGLVYGASAQCTKNILNYNAELAAAFGPFSFQGEYFGSHYNRSASALAYAAANGAGVNATGGTSLNFSGYYLQGMWSLTGESRAESYNIGWFDSAAFGAIHILHPVSAGGIGAWQIGARFSELNLNSGGIQGGRQEDVTVGLNWYPERGVRLSANWIHVAHLSAPFNRPYLNGINPDIFLMRSQFYW
jgi:phosphate-selective porin OprO/OprP